MARILSGRPVAEPLVKNAIEKTEALNKLGITPTLAVVRVGERQDDIAYENSILRQAADVGIVVIRYQYPKDITQEELIKRIEDLNQDTDIHGVLIFRPLPPHIDDRIICNALAPEKDVDGITPGSVAGVFMGVKMGFPPCTAESCMQILDYYGIDCSYKKLTVIGRSLVIGKPASMMALNKNATVTTCHSKTDKDDFRKAGQEADIVIVAIGKPKFIGPDDVGENQIILDVGVNVDEDGNLCGDVDFDKVEPKAAMITPPRGGVGSVTTAVLMKHVVRATEIYCHEIGLLDEVIPFVSLMRLGDEQK